MGRPCTYTFLNRRNSLNESDMNGTVGLLEKGKQELNIANKRNYLVIKE